MLHAQIRHQAHDRELRVQTAFLDKDLPDAECGGTSYGTSDGIAHALEVGAAGAMMKTADDEKIVATIRKIAAGGTCISPDIQRQLEANPPIPRLSARQLEVLQMVVDGKTSKEIASVLGIRPDSVDAVTRALFEKMNVSSRTEAVAIALRKHLL